MRLRPILTGILLGLTLVVTVLSARAVHAVPKPTSADELLVVNCLLPGQIRQLGRRTTYVSARQPLRTTALECRVKGGEYVLQDRANLQSALKVWLKAAQSGDSEAQTTLGEIFEQGLGVPADYDAARSWYEQAAAREFPRALTNLGNLYERGLGVAKDTRTALAYYRRAAGLPADSSALSIDTTSDVAPVDTLVARETEKLQAALVALQAQTTALKSALTRSQEELAVMTAEATDREANANKAEARRLAEVRDLSATQELRIRQYEQQIAQRDQQITNLTQTIQILDHKAADTGAAQAELAKLEQLFNAQQAQLDADRLRLNVADETVSDLESTVAAQNLMLAERDAEAQQQLEELNRLLSEIAALKARQSEETPVALSADATVAGPAIAIIDPVLPSTRGLVKVKLPRPSSADNRMKIVGRVTAPAGLLNLSINSVAIDANAAGVFTYDLPPDAGTDIKVTAIDQQGKRSDLRFALTEHSPTPAAPQPPAVDLGKYRALLIGNSNYQYLPKLFTPSNDIAVLKNILTNQYGFEVDTLLDANRYEILSALNDLRATLTSEDNLLIYYAGHGELDRANMRGHWLPVDAELTSTANWVSNVAITDILNVIRAKQIMLVVDSCYSGTLTRSSLTQIDAAMTDAERATWLNLMASKKARVVMTSGGLAPVLDSGGGEHSVFARAFLDALRGNGELMTGRSLYQAVAARVAHAAQAYEFEQIPAYAPIARSGHEAGDFMLLPTRF